MPSNLNVWSRTLFSIWVGWFTTSAMRTFQRHLRAWELAIWWRYIPKPKSSNNIHKGTQIDLVIDRADRIINLCEIKFSVKPYRITNEYETTLRNRIDIFKTDTKTSKAIANTFITTFGVADGKYHSIVDNEVTMNDLFN